MLLIFFSYYMCFNVRLVRCLLLFSINIPRVDNWRAPATGICGERQGVSNRLPGTNYFLIGLSADLGLLLPNFSE
jgi:hypothetical protein